MREPSAAAIVVRTGEPMHARGDRPVPLLGVHHVAIHTRNLARLRDFYVDVLGLVIVGGFPEHGIIFVDAGGTLVELIEDRRSDARQAEGCPSEARRSEGRRRNDGGPAGAREAEPVHRVGWNHLAWEVADVDATFAELVARGVAPRSPPESFPPEAPAFRIAFVADPDGNLLELIRPLAPRPAPLAPRQYLDSPPGAS